jgi:DNA adenine methylase
MWAGGKNKMIPKYLNTPGIPLDGFDTFVEPFFGGGAMSIYMYQNAPNIKKFIINDINSEMIGIYQSIRDDLVNFLVRMDFLEEKYLPLNKSDRKSFYYDLREEYMTDWKKWSPTNESATLYFLMKTAFNGVWQVKKNSTRFATPCGLLNQTTSCYDKNNVVAWNVFLQKVEMHSGDWTDCCSEIAGKSFYFMDPPYRDSFAQYGQTFNDDHHLNLIDFCKQKNSEGNIVFYCNRDCQDDFYNQHRGDLDLSSYPITYTVGRRATESDGSRSAKAATEILLHSKITKKTLDYFT